jgi:hypothetical protein
MPCRDDGWDERKCCSRAHVDEATDAMLREELAHREALKKAKTKLDIQHKKERAAKSKKIKFFVSEAEKLLDLVKDADTITFVASEDGKTETQLWRCCDFVEKFEAWLWACKPLPTIMEFEAPVKHHGKWFFHSWHAHDKISIQTNA